MNPTVLDPCCGSRMMWFDKQDQRVLFGDQRTESHVLSDGRALEIKPDVKLDFTNLPFPDNSFRLIASEILKLTPNKPLFGHVTKRHGGTIWLTFMKT